MSAKNRGGGAQQAASDSAVWQGHDYSKLTDAVSRLVDQRNNTWTVEQALQAAKQQIDTKKITNAVEIWGVVY
eukprot:73849-Rhodomonas_salina.1